MIPINIEGYEQNSKTPFLQSAFRPFFLGAGFFAVINIFVWSGFYLFNWENSFLRINRISSMTWHAHEMIYGYFLAVIAGFLLTSVRNWTHKQTLEGKKLFALFLLWVLARAFPFFDNPFTDYFQAAADLLFLVFLGLSIGIPVFKTKLQRNVPVVMIVLLMLIGNY